MGVGEGVAQAWEQGKSDQASRCSHGVSGISAFAVMGKLLLEVPMVYQEDKKNMVVGTSSWYRVECQHY